MPMKLIGRLVRQTHAAVLMEIDGVEHWLPKSQITNRREIDGQPEMFQFDLRTWLAREKGLAPPAEAEPEPKPKPKPKPKLEPFPPAAGGYENDPIDELPF